MTDILQNDARVAANNPNILTPLVGATPSPQMTPQMTTPQQAQQNIQANTAPIAQAGQAAAAPIGANVEAMTKALFAHDLSLDQGVNPFPQGPPGYVQNPADLYRGGAQFAQAQMGNINSSMGVIQNINNAYKTAMETVSNRILDAFKMQQDEKAKKRQDLISILTQTGGDYIDTDTGQKYHFPTITEKKTAESGGGNNWQQYLPNDGTTTTADPITAKLQAAGYTPEMIQEYKTMKGLQ